MKGIHGVPYHIIFSVVILVLLLILSMGFVYGKTDIPFEELWNLGPESGLATDPSQIPNTGDYGSGGVDRAGHIFTSGGTWDFSEIACLIGNVIYNDYTRYADNGPHNLNSYEGKQIDYTNLIPFEAAGGTYLLALGIFNYSDTILPPLQANEIKINDSTQGGAPGCHLCAITPGGATSTYPASILPAGAQSVMRFDESCLNLQLRDRRLFGSTDLLCKNLVIAPPSYTGTFGNNQLKTVNNVPDPPWNSVLGATFCKQPSSDLNKIRWYAEPTQNDVGRNNIAWPWNFTSSMGDDDSVTLYLQNPRQYIYGVFWNGGTKGYDVLFQVVPTTTNRAVTDWSSIWNSILTKGSEANSIYRRSGLGWTSWQVRVVADYIFTPTQPISGSKLMANISKYDLYGTASEDITKVLFNLCTDMSNCITGRNKLPGAEYCTFSNFDEGIKDFEKQPIGLYIKATLADGVTPITVPSQDLPAAKHYRVIIKNWFNNNIKSKYYVAHSCYDYYDRTVTIMEVTACTDLVANSQAGKCSVANPNPTFRDEGAMDCPPGEHCWAPYSPI